MKKTNKGFTILEILVVLSVIAILIGIAIPRFKGMQDEANKTKAKAEAKTLQAAVESFKTNTGAYPTSSTTVATQLLAASPKIIDAALYDPFEDGTVQYIYTLDGAYYSICSNGIDGATDVVLTGLASGTVDLDSSDDICVTNGTITE